MESEIKLKIKKKKPKFVRKDSNKLSKLGKRRKKKQKWVRPRGRDNKLRLKLKGYGNWPVIGYSQAASVRGTLKGLKPVLVHNLLELESVSKEEIAVLAAVGLKRKIELAKRASEKGIKTNINLKKFLESSAELVEERKKAKTERKKAEALKEKKKKEGAKKAREAREKEEEPKEKSEEEKEEEAEKEKEERKKILEKQVMRERPKAVQQKDVKAMRAAQTVKRKALEK